MKIKINKNRALVSAGISAILEAPGTVRDGKRPHIDSVVCR